MDPLRARFANPIYSIQYILMRLAQANLFRRLNKLKSLSIIFNGKPRILKKLLL